MTARKKAPTAAGKTGGAGGGLKEDTAAADSASSALAEADLLDGAALGGVLPGVLSSLTEHLELGVVIPTQPGASTETTTGSTSTSTTSSSSWQGSDIGGPMLDDDGYVATTTSDDSASATPMGDDERATAVAALGGWGVSPEIVSMMSDADLATNVADMANKQLLGAEAWDDILITPTSGAISAAAGVAELGGSFTINSDGSVTLYDANDNATTTIPAGTGGEGAWQDAMRNKYNLHPDAPVPSQATFAAATALAQKVGGTAVASVDGDMNVYDADDNLIKTYDADVFSQLEEIGEQVAAGAAKTQREAGAAAEGAANAIGAWLTDTVTTLSDSGSKVGTPEDQTDKPAGEAKDEGKPADPAAATPATTDEKEEDEKDDEKDDEKKDENENGIPDDEETPAEPAADAPAAGMPTPDGGSFDPAAYQRFLDSPLGKGAAELEEAAVGFRAGGSGAGDPVDDVTSVDTATLLAGTPFGDAWNESVRDGLEGVAGGGYTDPTDDGTGSSGTVDARSVADLAARRGGGVTDPPEDRGSGVTPPTLQGPATPMPEPPGGTTSALGASIASAVDDGIEANISQHLDLGGLADRLQVRIDVDVDLGDDLDLD